MPLVCTSTLRVMVFRCVVRHACANNCTDWNSMGNQTRLSVQFVLLTRHVKREDEEPEEPELRHGTGSSITIIIWNRGPIVSAIAYRSMEDGLGRIERCSHIRLQHIQ